MSKEKKKSIFDEIEKLFKEDVFGDIDSLQGGYSISVTQIGDKTTVRVKADRNTDIRKIKEELKRQYPNAEIIIEGGRPIIEEIKGEPKSEEEHSRQIHNKRPKIKEIK